MKTQVKALTKAQIEATMQRLRDKYGAKFEAHANAKAKADNATRAAQIKSLCYNLPFSQRKATEAALIKDTEFTVLNGMPYNGGYSRWNDDGKGFNTVLKELEYTLIMADNTTFQHAIDAAEKAIAKLLKS